MTPLARTGLVILAVLGLLLVLVLGLDRCSGAPERPTLLSEAELRAMSVEQREARIIGDIAQRLAYQGYAPSAWRHLPQPAAHLWAICSIEESISGYGFARLLPIRDETGDPSLSDAITAYESMGMKAVASTLVTAQMYIRSHPAESAPATASEPQPAPSADAALASSSALREARMRFLAALNLDAMQALRRAYIAEHLAELVQP
jgi:hypothetical protein